MLRLIHKNKTVPHGFVWIDPITTQEVSARNYPNWMAAATVIRVANGNPLPTEAEMEDQLCGRFDEKTRRRLCESYDDNGQVRNMGVGSTLKDMLARIGVKACWGCLNLAQRMDDWGPDECEAHMPEILEIMEDNAQKRNWMKLIPFREAGSKLLVQRAIKKVREQST
jgi:hypothetical protein